MKKILLAMMISFISAVSFAQTINISTGVATWKVSPTGSAANTITPHPIWATQVSTPVSGTGAQWISPTTSFNVSPGIYVYETIIPVGSTNGSLNLNFQVSVDDILLGLELEKPGGGTISLGVPAIITPKFYTLRKALDTTIKCPTKGEWKLKAKVQFLDALGGFILSGKATLQGTCCDCPIPNTNVNFSLCTTLGGGTTATASAIGASTGLGNGWTLKQVPCPSNNPCKWLAGGIKWQSTGSSISIPATVLSPGCYILTHYVNRCSKQWDPKACVSYQTICFTICDNAITVSPEQNPQALKKMQNIEEAKDEVEKEAEIIVGKN